MTIWCNRQVVLFQETVQFGDSTFARILIQVLHKTYHRFNRKTILQHSNHTSCQTGVQHFAFPEQSLALDRYVALTVVQYYFLRFNDIFNCVPVVGFNSLEYLVIGNVSFADSVRFISNDDNNIAALDQIGEAHLKTFQVIVKWMCLLYSIILV